MTPINILDTAPIYHNDALDTEVLERDLRATEYILNKQTQREHRYMIISWSLCIIVAITTLILGA